MTKARVYKSASGGFRFVPTGRRGEYGVHRGDVHLGFVTKSGGPTTVQGVTIKAPVRWTPAAVIGHHGATLEAEPTRDAAARALAAYRQRSGR